MCFYSSFTNHSGLKSAGSLLPARKFIRKITVFSVVVPSGTCRGDKKCIKYANVKGQKKIPDLYSAFYYVLKIEIFLVCACCVILSIW